MNTNNDHHASHIRVLPLCLRTGSILEPVVTSKLCFWDGNIFEHSICKESIRQFLKQAFLFGVAVSPKRPEKGCVIQESHHYNYGLLPVAQMFFEDQLIYAQMRLVFHPSFVGIGDSAVFTSWCHDINIRLLKN